MLFFFFFQAEDGIRDKLVTGVQTCALPISVVEVNRAVAYTMAFGPAAGLEIADSLLSEPALANYHLLPTVRGDFLAKLGRFEEARAEFERAAALTRNARERTLLLERAARVRSGL